MKAEVLAETRPQAARYRSRFCNCRRSATSVVAVCDEPMNGSIIYLARACEEARGFGGLRQMLQIRSRTQIRNMSRTAGRAADHG